jgi:1-aminocyclopropane-1-carboxylate deaminase/D-cysteine desulfhydrase-like pyridoxal-dependent ACC family enzyme
VARAAKRIDVEGQWIGRGYGHATPEGDAALEDGTRAGVVLDATYTAKAFAASLARVRAGASPNVLFWHTLSTAPRPDDDGAPIPRRFEGLFR